MYVGTFPLFVCVSLCMWPSPVLSSHVIFTFLTIRLDRICLAPSKRSTEMRGLFASFLLSSPQPLNYFLLLLRLPLPLLACLLKKEILWHVFFLSPTLCPPSYFADIPCSIPFPLCFYLPLNLSLSYDLRCMMY